MLCLETDTDEGGSGRFTPTVLRWPIFSNCTLTRWTIKATVHTVLKVPPCHYSVRATVFLKMTHHPSKIWAVVVPCWPLATDKQDRCGIVKWYTYIILGTQTWVQSSLGSLELLPPFNPPETTPLCINIYKILWLVNIELNCNWLKSRDFPFCRELSNGCVRKDVLMHCCFLPWVWFCFSTQILGLFCQKCPVSPTTAMNGWACPCETR